jgi:hypothetical protein
MASQNDHYRVYMSFQSRNGWHCQFLEADLKTSLPRKLHFASPEKIIELVERGGGIPALPRTRSTLIASSANFLTISIVAMGKLYPVSLSWGD